MYSDHGPAPHQNCWYGKVPTLLPSPFKPTRRLFVRIRIYLDQLLNGGSKNTVYICVCCLDDRGGGRFHGTCCSKIRSEELVFNYWRSRRIDNNASFRFWISFGPNSRLSGSQQKLDTTRRWCGPRRRKLAAGSSCTEKTSSSWRATTRPPVTSSARRSTNAGPPVPNARRTWRSATTASAQLHDMLWWRGRLNLNKWHSQRSPDGRRHSWTQLSSFRGRNKKMTDH